MRCWRVFVSMAILACVARWRKISLILLMQRKQALVQTHANVSYRKHLITHFAASLLYNACISCMGGIVNSPQCKIIYLPRFIFYWTKFGKTISLRPKMQLYRNWETSLRPGTQSSYWIRVAFPGPLIVQKLWKQFLCDCDHHSITEFGVPTQIH